MKNKTEKTENNNLLNEIYEQVDSVRAHLLQCFSSIGEDDLARAIMDAFLALREIDELHSQLIEVEAKAK